jgi:hypothetical protein
MVVMEARHGVADGDAGRKSRDGDAGRKSK